MKIDLEGVNILKQLLFTFFMNQELQTGLFFDYKPMLAENRLRRFDQKVSPCLSAA